MIRSAFLYLLASFFVLQWTGCGCSSSPSPGKGPTSGVPAGTPEAVVLRWVPEEHGEEAGARAWVREGTWKQDLERLRSGEDLQGGVFRAHLERVEELALRVPVVQGVLQAWLERPESVLAGILKEQALVLAKILPEILRKDPDQGLRLADRFLFEGEKRHREAWNDPDLRNAVIQLCARPDLGEEDLETGPRRAWALRVASKARLREAVEHLMKAAGYARSESGQPLAADPFEPAAALAREVIRENQQRRRQSRKSRPR